MSAGLHELCCPGGGISPNRARNPRPPMSMLPSLLKRWILASVLFPAAAWAAGGRTRENFDFGWRFFKGDAPGAEQPAFPDAAWRKLNLPHDWSIEGPYDPQAPSGGSGGYLPTGVGWYRKHFKAPLALKGKRVTIRFDGVYMNSDVWLNGHHLGHWPYGYTTFRYDLTPYLNFGDVTNVIAVRVDNSRQPDSRWYSGSGIDRNVWVTVTDPLRVAPDGIVVTTPAVAPDSATVEVRTRVTDGRPQPQEIELIQEIVGADGPFRRTTVDARVPAGADTSLSAVLTVSAPRLWSPATPYLYHLRTEILVGGKVVDSVETPFGIRSVVFDRDRGLLLNGRPIKMLGMCLHQDAGAVGSAVPKGVWERRLRLLKAMGCNAIRTSHNPPDPVLLDLCDRLGFLVMDEAFDEWTIRKPQIKFGYSDYFAQWYKRDLTHFIRRDRNHPCVVMWSAGNEVGEQREPGGPAILGKLVTVFRREDPTRPVTAAMDKAFTEDGHAPAAFTDLLDIVGYNYVDRWLDRRETYFGPDRHRFPRRRFVGTEDAGVHAVRGSYVFGSAPPGTPARALYAAAPIRTEQLWKFALTHDYDIGHFMWTGFDYLGEARWPLKAASSGALDTCGFPKDTYYLYQSLFTDKPMLHLLPSWNWPGREGQVIPVLAYTNCEVVELFLNGRSLGAKAREFPRQGAQGGWNVYARPRILPTTADLHLEWDVPYEPGEVTAVGYRYGRQVCRAEVRTAGAPAALTISADRATLRANARDVADLTVRVVDAHGIVVPYAADNVTFAIDGPAELLGVDNGDPASHEDYQADHRHAFNGKCLAIVQTRSTPGPIRIVARADHLKSASIELTSIPSSVPRPLFPALP